MSADAIAAAIATSAVHRCRLAVWSEREVDGLSHLRRFHGVVVAVAGNDVYLRDGERVATFKVDEILACDPVPTLTPRQVGR